MGAPQGGEFRVNSFTSGEQSDPAIALDADGDFAITWQSGGQDGSDYGIYAQRYNNAGAPQGVEFRVNSYTSSIQSTPAIALDADGDFALTWHSNGQDGNGYGIYAQRFNNAGMPNGSEFRVSTTTFGSQSESAITIDADGDTVIVWDGNPQDGGSYNIYAQRYNNAEVPDGGEFRVNTTTQHLQRRPAIAIDADGDTIIAWNSFGQDGSYYGIYAQRYNNTGALQGNEFRVNTTTSHYQSLPAVVLDVDGDAVIAWQSYHQDGNRYGIYAQRYAGAGKIETCGGVTATITGTAGPDILTGTAGDDVIAGLAGNDTLNGLGGNDRLCGGEGNDRMLGGSGNDLIRGAEGIDTVVFGGASGVTANLTTGIATGEGSDTLQLMENITGTSAADTLIGDAFNNVFTGGAGNDYLDGKSGSDTASFAGTAAVTVNLGTGTASGMGSDRLIGIEAVVGSNARDRLTGNGANNTLNGGSGNDIIQGVGGNDRLLGGSGNDSLNGGTGTDNCDGQTGTDTASACETVLDVP